MKDISKHNQTDIDTDKNKYRHIQRLTNRHISWADRKTDKLYNIFRLVSKKYLN